MWPPDVLELGIPSLPQFNSKLEAVSQEGKKYYLHKKQYIYSKILEVYTVVPLGGRA